VYLACRSKEAASDTIRVLRSASLAPGNGELKFLRLDLSDPGEAKKAAEEFLQLESRLDVLSRCWCLSMLPIERANASHSS
jgi:hypothetical protein